MFWTKNINVENRAVLITGCDSGFGNLLALRLNKKGFRVYATVLDTNNCGSKELIENCVDRDHMKVIQMDVTKQLMINDCFKFVKNDLDNNDYILWALVNNAGVLSYGLTNWGQFDEYKRVFEVNTFGVVRVTRKFSPLIIQSQGRIVIMASMSGRVSDDLLGIYGMSKSAVISYSDALRREMKRFNVKVSTIEPWLFKTGMYNDSMIALKRTWNQTDPDVRKLYSENYVAAHLKDMKNYQDDVSDELFIVVNDMLKAIISETPNIRYVPAPDFICKLVTFFLPIIPQAIYDFCALYNFKLGYMIKAFY